MSPIDGAQCVRGLFACLVDLHGESGSQSQLTWGDGRGLPLAGRRSIYQR